MGNEAEPVRRTRDPRGVVRCRPLRGAHDLDHDPPDFIAPDEPLGTSVNSGGPNADWELVTSVATGNPHTDLDFFTQGDETYAAVGTLGVGINKGGQSIVRLTDNGQVSADGVELVSAHPSASA